MILGGKYKYNALILDWGYTQKKERKYAKLNVLEPNIDFKRPSFFNS